MEHQLYTVHEYRRTGELDVVGEPTSFAGIPLLWPLYEGLWILLALQLAALIGATLYSPFALSPMLFGLAVLGFLEGNLLKRLEMRLRGWRRIGWVEANSPEGAEEAWRAGEGVGRGGVARRPEVADAEAPA